MINSRFRLAAAGLLTAVLTGTGFVGVAAAAASPASASPATASTASSGTVRTVTHSSSGKTINLKKGHELAVDLRTVYTAGYEWFWTQRPAKGVIKVVSKRLKPYRHKSGEVGYPYHTIFLLKAVGSGTTTIKLVERRSFDKTDVAAHFTLTIRVPATKSS